MYIIYHKVTEEILQGSFKWKNCMGDSLANVNDNFR